MFGVKSLDGVFGLFGHEMGDSVAKFVLLHWPYLHSFINSRFAPWLLSPSTTFSHFYFLVLIILATARCSFIWNFKWQNQTNLNLLSQLFNSSRFLRKWHKKASESEIVLIFRHKFKYYRYTRVGSIWKNIFSIL